MSEASSATGSETSSIGRWDRFWFTPAEVQRAAMIRGWLCVITAIYFVSCWSDAEYWYTGDGPLSPEHVASFLQTSGLDSAARWIFSPLFLTGSLWLYRGYLILGVAASFLVAFGRGGRIATWGLWLLFIGWANRAMLLSSLTESALSLGLFAAAIAPPAAMVSRSETEGRRHWSAGFALRLLSAQVTVLMGATFATMLGGRVWFNGLGAYALAASAEDRTIDWTKFAIFRNSFVHESLTHLLMLILPLGLVLAWLPSTQRAGKLLLISWCVLIGSLHSDWLYAATLATMLLAIDRRSG